MSKIFKNPRDDIFDETLGITNKLSDKIRKLNQVEDKENLAEDLRILSGLRKDVKKILRTIVHEDAGTEKNSREIIDLFSTLKAALKIGIFNIQLMDPQPPPPPDETKVRKKTSKLNCPSYAAVKTEIERNPDKTDKEKLLSVIKTIEAEQESLYKSLHELSDESRRTYCQEQLNNLEGIRGVFYNDISEINEIRATGSPDELALQDMIQNTLSRTRESLENHINNCEEVKILPDNCLTEQFYTRLTNMITFRDELIESKGKREKVIKLLENLKLMNSMNTKKKSSKSACVAKKHEQTMKYLETVDTIRGKLITVGDRAQALLSFIDIASDLNDRRRALLIEDKCMEETELNTQYR